MAGTIVIQRLTDDRKQDKSAPLVDFFFPRVKVRDVGGCGVCSNAATAIRTPVEIVPAGAQLRGLQESRRASARDRPLTSKAIQ